ncbi:enoyl-CoA hydratase [Azospirillum halopraeferens]|uniref:enoyl-CoA hydratase n=1 Tax=Azospirillum halopraeferens TaxID=34010 RepID=UPI0003FFDC23|nr:enoyl-CoA hydratase [Azospirillum halopraeferens]
MSETVAQDHILVSDADGVLEIRLNRPEKRNAITNAMYAAMADALERAAADPAIRAVLFSGAGDGFTGGNDLQDFLSAPPLGEDSPGWRFLTALRDAPKPLVAAVHGSAVGIGTTMLLHCDLVYAGRSARLALPFVRLGLVPEAGSSLLLPRLVGHQKAAELLILGEPFDADTAQALGLVNRVVEDEALPAAARAAAAAIAALPAAAVRETKRLLKRGAPGLTDCMEEEIRVFRDRLRSAEFRETAAAFLEKRPPGRTAG